MPALWKSGLLGFVVTIAAILVLRPLAVKAGFVDTPGGRKRHVGEVPLIGGLALFVTLVLVSAALNVHWPRWMPALLVASLAIVLLGAVDDRRDLRPACKILVQIGCALIMVLGGGLKLHTLGNLSGAGAIHTGDFTVLFSAFCIFGVMNAANLLDGANGLAGGVCLIAGLTFAVAAGMIGAAGTEAMLFLFAGGLSAFLLFNFRLRKGAPSRVFLGNAGSLFLGLILASAAIDLSQRPGAAMPPICAVWVAGLLIVDTLSVMSRRLARRRNPFKGDRSHLQHLLLAAGLEERYAVASLWLAQIVLSAVGIVAWLNDVPERIMFYALLAVFVVYSLVVELAWRRINRHARRRVEVASPVRLGHADFSAARHAAAYAPGARAAQAAAVRAGNHQ